MLLTEWLLCPICKSKTSIKLRKDTELRNFPLYCPKCKLETLVSIKELLEGKETLIKGIKNKDKKSYNAVVKIGEKGYIDFISFSK